MKTHNKTILTAITALGMIGTSGAAVIFDASTTNTTTIANAGQGGVGTVTGSPGSLVYTSPANNFNNSGFTSTDTINTLLGTSLAATDVITVTLSIDSMTGSALRSNGLFFGLGGGTTQGSITDADALGAQLNNNNNGNSTPGGVALASSGTVSPAGTITDASILDGFTATLTANSTGYSYVLEGLSTSPITISGSLTEAEFLGLGSTHFYFTAQQFDNSSLVTTFSEASIDVTSVPEPSSAALLGLGGLALILRRRK